MENPANPFNDTKDGDATYDPDNPFNTEPETGPYDDLLQEANPEASQASQVSPAGAVLEFQSFSHSAGYGIAGEIENPSQQGAGVDQEFEDTDNLLSPTGGSDGGGAPAGTTTTSTGGIPGLKYCQPFFDVDTSDVLDRVLQAALPIKRTFLDTSETSPKPDLWGPFWIGTTLIVMMAICGNFASYLNYWSSGATSDWQYDFNMVTFAVSLVYSYITVVPLLVFAAFKCLEVPVGVMQLLCLYGYSLFVFVPAAILCILPAEFLRWLVVMVALALSTAHLLGNLWQPLSTQRGKSTPVLAAIAIVHAGLALTLKLFFFSYAHISADDVSTEAT